jgi:hypothetical protein
MMPVDPYIARGMPDLSAAGRDAYNQAQQTTRRNALIDQQVSASKSEQNINEQNALVAQQQRQAALQAQQEQQSAEQWYMTLMSGDQGKIASLATSHGIDPNMLKDPQTFERTKEAAFAGAYPQQYAAAKAKSMYPPQQKSKNVWAVPVGGKTPVLMSEDQAMQTGAGMPPPNVQPKNPIEIQNPNDPTSTIFVSPENAIGKGGASNAKSAKAEEDQAAFNDRTIAQGHQMLDVMQKQVDNLKDMANWQTVGPIAAKNVHGEYVHPNAQAFLPGINNVDAALNTIKSNVFFTDIQQMKNAKGQTGIGRILQSEVPLLMSKYGALSQAQDPATFKKSLDELMIQMRKVQSQLEMAKQASPTTPATKPSASAPIGDLLNYYNSSKPQ